MRPECLWRVVAMLAWLLAAGSIPPALADDDASLDQNWSSADKRNWYELSQGSRLMPLTWLQALEQPGSTERFLDDAYIARLGFIPRDNSSGQHLPLGFAVDTSDDTRFTWTKLRWKPVQGSREPWVGLTCSACHTGEIKYQGRTLRIEGGPANADFQLFIEGIVAALTETRADPGKWARFASRILGTDAEPAARDALGAAFDAVTRQQTQMLAMNASPTRYGPGRLDAFGHIFNKIAYVSGANPPSSNPADAPVSYPFLWNVPQHEWVQWNGVAQNLKTAMSGFDLGALGRNAGEVIGVFGELTLTRDTGLLGLGGYVSSIRVDNLWTLERQLQKLRPPAWPALFPKPDLVKARRGELLYKQRCETCHQLLASRTDLTTPIGLKMGMLKPVGQDKPIGTDPWMACNAFTYTAASGLLQGKPIGYFQVQMRRLEPVDSLAPMLATAVGGALVSARHDLYTALGNSLFSPSQLPSFALELLKLHDPDITKATEGRPARLATCMTRSSEILGYKARPLNGIWATAPYLHNGSVASLYQMLLPADQRAPSTHRGSLEFDPVDVGLVATPGGDNRFELRSRSPDGRPIDGDSNAGHDYGNETLSEEDRRALVEYLKML